jgi:hypothetical protein
MLRNALCYVCYMESCYIRVCQCRDRLRPGPVVLGVQPPAKTEASRFTMLPEAALGCVASERYGEYLHHTNSVQA